MVVPSSSESSPSEPATGLEVRPFRALTYRRRDPEHLARVSSPAYDLVTATGRDRLAEADPHNIVRLILPRIEPAADASGRGSMRGRMRRTMLWGSASASRSRPAAVTRS